MNALHLFFHKWNFVFLVALAVQKKRIQKTGDVAQVFCQLLLPQGEIYICQLPHNCLLTPSRFYLKLKKTLYGLWYSPRHFYDLTKKTLEEVDLKVHPSSPCLFSGAFIKGHPPLYIWLYINDVIYFLENPAVETKFKTEFGSCLDTNFNSKVGYFPGIKFTTKELDDGQVEILLTQEALIDNLCTIANLDSNTVNKPHTLYCSGISTITNMCAKYIMICPSKGHTNQVKCIIWYLKGTKSKGISFSSKTNPQLLAFIKFPIRNQIVSLCDANWGPQDQSVPPLGTNKQVELFKNRSVSGFLVWLGGPIHWVSKRQSFTARSSTESEIYATNECI